jgi:hypothetical protein
MRRLLAPLTGLCLMAMVVGCHVTGVCDCMDNGHYVGPCANGGCNGNGPVNHGAAPGQHGGHAATPNAPGGGSAPAEGSGAPPAQAPEAPRPMPAVENTPE